MGDWLQVQQSTPYLDYGDIICAAYDEARHEVVLLTDVTDSNLILLTWTYNNGKWQQKFPANPPPYRFEMRLAYDAIDKYVSFSVEEVPILEILFLTPTT